MKQSFLTRFALGRSATALLLFSGFWVIAPVCAAEVTPVIQPLSVQPAPEPALSVESSARRVARLEKDQAAYRQWKISLAPVVASQVLDVASSYGMRELNPMLAGPDGRFGAQGAGIKLGSTAAILSIEYLIARRHPHAASILSKINWSVSIATTGFAAHNFAIR
jgi:hypothetical protein